MRPSVLLAATLLLLTFAVPGSAAAVQRHTDDASWLVDDIVYPDPIDIAVRLSRAAFPTPPAGEGLRWVVLARDDAFADAVPSGVLQRHGPLLLVPGHDRLPDAVVRELRRLRPDEVVVLGGAAAVGEPVLDHLATLDVPVRRVSGPTRVETAVRIAELAAREDPGSRTALVVRADASPSGQPTAAFADALAVGAWAAEAGWPVLLTTAGSLPPPVRRHLVDAGVTRVVVVGGEAAVGPGVVEEIRALGVEVDRIAGATREATAVRVAEARGLAPADLPAGVIVAEGHLPDAWAGGLAAAALSATTRQPILVADGHDAPVATLPAFAAQAEHAAAEGDHPGAAALALTCVSTTASCDGARLALHRPALATVAASHSDGAPVRPGEVVTFTPAAGGRPDGLVAEVTAVGTCLTGPVAISDAVHEVGLADPLPAGSCTLGVDVTLRRPDGTTALVQRDRRRHPTVHRPLDGRPVFLPAGTTLDPTLLARTLLPDDVVVVAARHTGAALSFGLVDDSTTLIGADHGVVLATGSVADLAGPNARPFTTTDLGQPGDPALAPLAQASQGSAETHDASVLEVDVVVPPGRSVTTAAYAFGSEEYEEFSDARGDVIDIAVAGVGCAWLDGLPVNARTVGPARHAESYRSNADGALHTELDGLTSGLSCTAATGGRGVIRVRLAIADVGDAFGDSALLVPGDALLR